MPQHGTAAQEACEAKSLMRACNLSVQLGGKQLFSGVGFGIHSGERVALLGNNGAGKSTLLALLAGVFGGSGKGTEVGGEVFHGTSSLEALSLAQRLRAFAWLPQALWRDPHFDVRSFLSLSPKNVEADTSKMRAAQAWFDVEGLGDRNLNALSGGEWRRVQLAKTFGSGARLLLLDEPSAGLDLRHMGALRLAMTHHCEGASSDGLASKSAGAVFFSTHDLALVAACATHVCVLEAGGVPFWGTFEAFRTNNVASELFGVRVRWHTAEGAGGCRWFPEISI